MKKRIEFKNREHLLVISNRFKSFNLHLINDQCFRQLFSDQLIKICRKLDLAYLTWTMRPKKLSFSISESLVIKKYVELSMDDILSDPISMCLLLPTTL